VTTDSTNSDAQPAARTDQPKQGDASNSAPRRDRAPESIATARSALIYCGLCGALNPATNHYCAACGSTLVDAFHASEGLRVFERPDAASRIIEIVPSGSELDIVEDPEAPTDYVRVRLGYGRLGYVRLQEVAELAEALEAGAFAAPASRLPTPDINVHARGCITPTAALSALALMLVGGVLLFLILLRADAADAGVLGLLFCVVLGPLVALTIGLYVYSRDREDRLEEEADEASKELA
jgi:hypothetical protein